MTRICLSVLLLIAGCDANNKPQNACGLCKPITVGGSMVIGCTCKEKR